MAKDSTGASGRKMLADISNIQQKHSTLTQDKKSLPNSAIVKEKFIEQLQKVLTFAILALLKHKKMNVTLVLWFLSCLNVAYMILC